MYALEHGEQVARASSKMEWDRTRFGVLLDPDPNSFGMGFDHGEQVALEHGEQVAWASSKMEWDMTRFGVLPEPDPNSFGTGFDQAQNACLQCSHGRMEWCECRPKSLGEAHLVRSCIVPHVVEVEPCPLRVLGVEKQVWHGIEIGHNRPIRMQIRMLFDPCMH